MLKQKQLKRMIELLIEAYKNTYENEGVSYLEDEDEGELDTLIAQYKKHNKQKPKIDFDEIGTDWNNGEFYK